METLMETLLINEKEFNNFLNFIDLPLHEDEVNFMSLSARNKYLDEEERVKFSLGRAEMFGRVIVRNKDFKYAFNKLYANFLAHRTRNDLKIPTKCLVVYININPSSMIKAYNEFKNNVDKIISDGLLAYRNESKPNLIGLNNLDGLLKKHIAHATSRKKFIDIDIDGLDADIALEFIEKKLNQVGIFEFGIVRSKGGIHLLLFRDYLKHSKINLNQLCIDTMKYAKTNSLDISEVIINKNMMVPCPGTLQGDRLVKFEYILPLKDAIIGDIHNLKAMLEG